MTTFVLVHGAWRGSWCWKRVRRLLQIEGHEVFTPTLTGLGERSHLASPNVGLDTHILDIFNLLRWEQLSDVVLSGHSYGGAIVTGVADRAPDQIRALVYVDAFVPEDGENLGDRSPPDRVADGWKVLPPPARSFNVNDRDRDWVDAQCTAQSLACWEQSISLTGASDRVPRTFVLATGWGGEEPPSTPEYEKANRRGWNTVALKSGHDVMLDQPEELTRILTHAATAT